MRPWRSLGEVPRKRHTHTVVDGNPLFEELFGREGFSGPSSLLYHRHLPEGAHGVTAVPNAGVHVPPPAAHTHAHIRAGRAPRGGDWVGGRRHLLVNDDVRIAVALPSEQQTTLTVNGTADEVVFIHDGSGVLHTTMGRLTVRTGDYVVIPRGVVHTLELADPGASRLLVVECAGMVDSPERYRARNGQLTEFAPYSERDVRGPERLEPREGPAEVLLRRGDSLTRYELDRHPFDVVGWDGTVYPCALSVHDFEPRAGRFHLPPPMHQVFTASNVVICNFVPRLVDWDPDANWLPYHHSNLDSDEVMYYAEGEYRARRGIERGSITHHVGGLPHGPQPGALEASRGLPRVVDELAVMVDTFRPLRRTADAAELDDPGYPFSWHQD